MSNPAAVIPPSVMNPEITECLCITVILPHPPGGFQDGNQSLFQNDEKKKKKSDLLPPSKQPAKAAALRRHKGERG